MKSIIFHFVVAIIFAFLTVMFYNSSSEAQTFNDGVNMAIAFLCLVNAALYSVSGAIYAYSFIKSGNVNK